MVNIATGINAGETVERTEGSRTFAIVVCLFSSLGGLFFGYDQGVSGGVLIMDSFLKAFCVGYNNYTLEQCQADASDLPSPWLTFTTLYNVIYYLGCVVGAFSAGFLADRFGRRFAIFFASIVFCAGTCWLCWSPAMAHDSVLGARFFAGVGVGSSSFSLPIFAAEMAPKEFRGMLSGFMQMTVVTGLLIAGIVNIIVKHNPEGWRITNGVCMIAPVILMIGIFFVPESPRWLYVHKGKEAAKVDLKRLRQTENVDAELTGIEDAVLEEGDGKSKFSDVFHPKIRRRLFIACSLQFLQQATGINPMFTYGGQIFQEVVGNGIISLLILQIVNFLATIPGMYWVDRYGRRSMLLCGGVGMVISHLLSAIIFSAGCTGSEGCDKGSGWAIIIFSAFFIFNFAYSWGPICWVYPAEIFPLHVRATAVSLSSMSNWCVGTLMIGIQKLFPYLHINGVFFLFAALCSGATAFVYFMCPETKGILLEDIEALFNGTSSSEGKDEVERDQSQYSKAATPKNLV